MVLLLAPPCQISVLGAFTGGGNSDGKGHRHPGSLRVPELHFDYSGQEFVRFGGRLRDVDESNSSTANFNGTFTFPSLDAYQITEQGLQAGWSDAQAGGPSQFFDRHRHSPRERQSTLTWDFTARTTGGPVPI